MNSANRTFELLNQILTEKRDLVNALIAKGESVSMSDPLGTLTKKVETLPEEATLIEKEFKMNDTYHAGTYGADGFSKVIVNVDGGVECPGAHVIEVEELPTEHIDESAMYKCRDNYYQYGDNKVITGGVDVHDGSIVTIYADELSAMGMTLYYSASYPKFPIESSENNLHLYYIESENDVFVYADPDNNMPTTPEWISYFGRLNMPFHGAIASIDDLGETPEDGFYVLIGVNEGWKSYGNPYIIDVVKLPTENIVEDAIYRVKEEKCVDVGVVIDGQYMSISVLIMAFVGEPIPLCIYNVDSLDSVENPVSSIIHWYYCRADRTLYSYNSENNEWDAADGKDDDSIPGLTPSWKVKDDYAYYQYHNEPFSDIAVVFDMEGIQTTMSVGDVIPEAQTTFNTISAKIHDDSIRTSVFDNSDTEEITEEFHFYYIESEKDIFVYGDPGATGADDWHKTSDLYVKDMPEMTFNGFVLDETEATKEGYYAIGGSGWKKHVRTRGTLLLTEPGQTEDVTEFSKVRCVVPHVIDVTTLPETVPVSDNIYYYVESENDIFLYCKVLTYSSTNYSEYETKWVTAGAHSSDIATGLTFKGVISSQDMATEAGYYAVIVDDKFTDIIAYVDGFPISLAATATAESRTIELHKVNTKPENKVNTDSVYKMGGNLYQYSNSAWKKYLVPSGTKTITANEDGVDVTEYAKVNVQVPVPVIMEWPEEITENGVHYASTVDADGISKATINVPTAQKIPEFYWTLRDTLDFSMIPTAMLGSIHFIYFDLPDSDIEGNKPYIGLRISDGKLTAIQYDAFATEITLYDANGWVDPGYKNLHCGAAIVSGVLYRFLGTNYVDLISFTVSGTTMQAERGMTWGEWIASSYNHDDFIASGNNVSVSGAPSNHILYDEYDVDVLLTEEITNGGIYSF